MLTVGVELEEEQTNHLIDGDDGSINGVRLFKCPVGRALFVSPEQCSIDRRFQEVKVTSNISVQQTNDEEKQAADHFGNIECPIVRGSVPPKS